MNWKTITTIGLLVFLAALVGLSTTQTVIEQRPLNAQGLTEGMSFGTGVPTLANDGRNPFNGEPFIVRSDGSDPLHRIFNESTSNWDTTPALQRANAWIGANTYTTFREDFNATGFLAFENDSTPAVVTDAGVNALWLFGPGNIPMIGYRLEQALADTIDPGLTQGVFTVDGFVDNVDNDGIQFTFGAHDNATTAQGAGISFNETSSNSMYCEIQIDIADISAVDDFWFGWVLNDATDNPPASADFDTAAIFTLLDNTGDLIATAMLNNAAEVVNDTGVDWTDGDQFILRVTMLADSVIFAAELDDGGSTVDVLTTTTAVLNADDGDVLKCVMGFTNVAAESLGVTLNYIEIGDVQ